MMLRGVTGHMASTLVAVLSRKDALHLPPLQRSDPFTRLALPPPAQWPELRFDLSTLQYPAELNCADTLLSLGTQRAGSAGHAIVTGDSIWTYADLTAATNRLARVLREDLGLIVGGRVLLRGPNTPQLFACWLAVVKAGGVAVTTMPLLREGELRAIVEKAQISLALCDQAWASELASCVGSGLLDRLVLFGDGEAEMDALAWEKPATFEAAPTKQDDVCLIAFTSGTTGAPKAAMHFHRDVLSMCHTYAAHRLPVEGRAVFCGTPPIGLTFGLGALLAFPLYFGATVVLPDASTPEALADIIALHRVTHFFTSPTGYRAILEAVPGADLSSLRVAVSAGEHLPQSTSEAWHDATGLWLLDGISATELIHIFISSDPAEIRPGSVGKPVPGYTVALFDEGGELVEGAGVGRLAVRGPVGCRYLDDARQTEYVQRGWNFTGDTLRRDNDGFYWFLARSDDMIVSSGYNIAAPEVEHGLIQHEPVAECAVVGVPDTKRGTATGKLARRALKALADQAPAPKKPEP